MIYLDNAATTKPFKETLETYNTVNEKYFFNAASVHKGGQEVSQLLEASRSQMKELLNLNDYGLIFTSGATESNNIAIQSTIKRKIKFGNTVLVSELEHPSVIEVLRNIEGINLVYINTKRDGIIDLEDLKEKMNEDVIFVSIIAVNNIVGSVNPVEEIIKIVKEYNRAFLHIDATQAIGKIDLDYNGVDALTLSAHKFYGVKGVGALFIKEINALNPVMYGGGHEFNIRSGTVNVPGIVSMAKALRLATENMNHANKNLKSYNKKITDHFKDYKAIYIQPSHLPNYINMSINGVKGEVIVNALSKRSIYVSTTSACASQRDELNETLIAMGNKNSVIEGSIRITMGQYTTEEEVDQFITVFDEIYKELGDVFIEL